MVFLARLYLIEILHQTTTSLLETQLLLRLYLIEILHQTTTTAASILIAIALYLIEILHQTTTPKSPPWRGLGCILLKFYIKPQLCWLFRSSFASCILLKFYIKPQP